MHDSGTRETRSLSAADAGFVASLAAIALASLALEPVVDGTVLTMTGSLPQYYPLPWQMLTWVLLGVAWYLVYRGTCWWLSYRGVALTGEPFGERPILPHRRVRAAFAVGVAAVLVGLIAPVFLQPEGQAPPIRLYFDLYALYGSGAWLGMVAYAAFLVGRCAVAAVALAAAQEAVELRWPGHWPMLLPVGGLVVGVVMGVVSLLTGGGIPGLLITLACSTLLGMAHNLSGQSLRWTWPLTVAVFLFL